MRRVIGVSTLGLVLAVCTPAALGRVLRVGSYHGIRGHFATVQAAVDTARPGDWILIGPGDYKERADHRARRGPQPPDAPAGVVIAKAGLRLRGMDRNAVVIDGTRAGSRRCSAGGGDQDFGPAGAAGKGPLGRNGILVWKAANVRVQNLTVCNFLGGSGNVGNEIWWNGGDGSGQIGGHGFFGSYLSTTSTFFREERSAAKYGVFSSNWSGGTWDQVYASNFNDGAFYIGACRQSCDQTIDHAHAQFSALGYSGTNSGGRLVVKHSEFDHNKDGFDTNSQNADLPPPQDGACPDNKISPITHTHSCWVFMHNYVHDNNNPNVPYAGSAGAGPVGTGMSMAGARNDTVMDNTFARNGAWGLILVPYLDNGPPCTGGTQGSLGCLYDSWGNALIGNRFVGNGFFGHPTNGDFQQIKFESNHPTNCYQGNHRAGGSAVLPASAQALQSAYPVCNGRLVAAGSSDPPFLNEVLCDAQIQIVSGVPSPCPSGQYPRRTRVIMQPLARQRTMPDPCANVPVNPWCPVRRHRARGR